LVSLYYLGERLLLKVGQQSLEQFTLAFGEMDVDRLGSVDKRKFYAWYHSKKKPEAFTTSERSQLQEIVSHPLESHSLEVFRNN
jgi:hypothetical protein